LFRLFDFIKYQKTEQAKKLLIEKTFSYYKNQNNWFKKTKKTIKWNFDNSLSMHACFGAFNKATGT
jgi:tRNA A37 N6-isopentenylltransferase MiaA